MEVAVAAVSRGTVGWDETVDCVEKDTSDCVGVDACESGERTEREDVVVEEEVVAASSLFFFFFFFCEVEVDGEINAVHEIQFHWFKMVSIDSSLTR